MATAALIAAAAVAMAVVAMAAVPRSTNAGPGLSRQSAGNAAKLSHLNSALDRQQARQQGLTESISTISRAIGQLGTQIALVRSREAAIRTELGQDRASLSSIQLSQARERQDLAALRGRLTHARMLLARQLVSSYESENPDLVGVVVDANGFNDLLERIDFLRRAEDRQQSIIKLTQTLKRQAQTAAGQLAMFQAAGQQVTAAAAVRAQALSGMDTLLQQKQAALASARDAQQAALNASRDRGQELQAAIARLRDEQAAAQEAASSASSSQGATPTAPSQAHSRPPSAPPPASAGTDLISGWAIPYQVVLCESGGQNLPPNGAGASGYYQIIPATWKQYGGHGPAAYLASKAQQDAVASHIWNRGAGASNWNCAGILGIS